MSIADFCTTFISDMKTSGFEEEKDIIEFITAPWGLGLGSRSDIPNLYPAQRFIIKAYYGLGFDNSSHRDIIINDKFNEIELYRFNEQEYCDYLYNEGRLNKKYDGYSRENMVLICGRRAGKSTITSCIIAYETYRLLSKFCPQEYYGIMPESDIRITSISTSKETASELFNMVTGHLERSEFFRKYRTNPTKQWMYLKTQRDLEKYGPKGRSSISIHVAPCNAKGLRGHSNIVIALDEMAFFFADEKSGKTTRESKSDRDDRAIYKAVTPSVAKFKRPTGDPDGKIICISSPAGKSGKFFEEYQRGFNNDNDDLLVMRAPTWEIDPGLSSQYLKSKYKENPISFRSEFGAEFSDRLFGWIDDPKIVRQAYVPDFRYKQRSSERVPHFMGIDIGLKNDGSAITIGHWVKELVGGAKVDRIEVDASDIRYASLEVLRDDEGFERDYFIPEELGEWIAEYTKKFYILKGLMDQYYGMSIIPILHKKKLRQFEFRSFTDILNSLAYQTAMTTFISKEIKLPEIDNNRTIKVVGDLEEEADTELVRELLSLQAEQKSKYLIKVSAKEGGHDDLSDSFVRMVLLASEYRNKGFTERSTGSSSPQGAVSNARQMRRRERIKAGLNRPSGQYMSTMQSRRTIGYSSPIR